MDKLGCAVVLDVSAHAIALSARGGLMRLARASIGQLPFADGAFDGVTAFDVLCHSAVEDDQEARFVDLPFGLTLVALARKGK